jgi:hypothetical protein
MISVKNFVFTKIYKRYFNKKIYLDGKKLKMTVFSSLITSLYSLRPQYFFMFKFFLISTT